MTRSGFVCLIGLVLLPVVIGCGKSGDDGATAASDPAVSTKVDAKSPPSSGVIQTSATAPVEEGDPIVVLHTTLGSMYVRLYEQHAPRTVANFMNYARVGHYDGTLFHQVDAGFVAIGGAFDKALKAKPVRYPVASEATNGRKNVRGSLAMIRDPNDPNSATAMFFVNLADNSKLDHQGTTPEQYGFCVFGQVIDGLDVLDKLNAVKTGQKEGFTSLPVESVVLNSVRLVR